LQFVIAMHAPSLDCALASLCFGPISMTQRVVVELAAFPDRHLAPRSSPNCVLAGDDRVLESDDRVLANDDLRACR